MDLESALREAAAVLKVPPADLAGRIGALVDENRKLERSLAAHENLRKALRWGPGALSATDAALAVRLEKQLEARLGQIEVRCSEPMARISVNSAPWFTCAPRPSPGLGLCSHERARRRVSLNHRPLRGASPRPR